MSIPLAPGGNDVDNDVGNGPGGKTEWEDALIKHKIWKPRQNLPREDDVQLALQDIRDAKDDMEDKSLGELEEMEDEIEEDFLEKYRKKRLEELKAQQQRERFGSVLRISEPEFVKEVSEASKEASVVVHLFSFGKDECKLLNQIFAELADRRKDVKFVIIPYNEAIRDYPESATPTVLLYRDGNNLRQIVGLGEFGGRKMNVDCLEWVLAGHKLLKTDLDQDPRLKLARPSIQRLGGGGSRQSAHLRLGRDEDDSDDSSDLSDFSDY